MTNPPSAHLEQQAREAAFVAFALRCSAGNPAAIGSARNEAVGLLERFGFEPRRQGVFYHNLADDERNAAAMLAFRDAPKPAPEHHELRNEARLLAKAMWFAAWGAYYYHSDQDDEAAIDAILALISNPSPDTSELVDGTNYV